MRHRGCLITFEGLDGSGKTVQSLRLYKSLNELGFKVSRTCEPSGTSIGKSISNIIKHPPYKDMDPNCELFLFAAARCENVKQKILPAIRKGNIVICDRFIDSTVAYQSYGRSALLSTVNSINNIAIREAFPDITIYLDIPPELSEQRITDRSKKMDIPKDKFEQSIDFLQKVYRGYQAIIKDNPDRFLIVDGSKNISTIAAEILNAILSKLEIYSVNKE